MCSGAQAAHPELRPVVDPGFGVPMRPGGTSTAAQGERCAAGFCENPRDCPHCADDLTCNVPQGMMCAGTVRLPPAAPPSCAAVLASDAARLLACAVLRHLRQGPLNTSLSSSCLRKGACSPETRRRCRG